MIFADGSISWQQVTSQAITALVTLGLAYLGYLKLVRDLNKNTQVTQATHTIVNGEKTAMKEENERLKAENAKLKGQP